MLIRRLCEGSYTEVPALASTHNRHENISGMKLVKISYISHLELTNYKLHYDNIDTAWTS